MKTKPKFNIGDWVRAMAYVEFNYDKFGKRMADKTKLEQPIIGQIVGARTRFLGTYDSGHPHYPDGDYEAPYLKVKGSIIVWLVTEGYLNKPYEVMEEDIEPWLDTHVQCIRLTTAKDPQLPWRKTNMTWTESDKADLRKIMKNVPRDSKGRWIK